MPGVPVMHATLPGMIGGSWWGVAGPKGLSPEWVAWWSSQIGQCVRRPEVRARLTESLIDESDTSTAAFREEITRERRIWADVIRNAGIRVEG
jgi:tripartite-type tricarboxylate transporter receptor subunit TctC